MEASPQVSQLPPLLDQLLPAPQSKDQFKPQPAKLLVQFQLSNQAMKN